MGIFISEFTYSFMMIHYFKIKSLSFTYCTVCHQKVVRNVTVIFPFQFSFPYNDNDDDDNDYDVISATIKTIIIIINIGIILYFPHVRKSEILFCDFYTSPFKIDLYFMYNVLKFTSPRIFFKQFFVSY